MPRRKFAVDVKDVLRDMKVGRHERRVTAGWKIHHHGVVYLKKNWSADYLRHEKSRFSLVYGYPGNDAGIQTCASNEN